jgi:hypothetical protein
VQGQILLTTYVCESGLLRQAATKAFALTCTLQLSIFFFSRRSTALVALSLIYKVLRSHSNTTHSVTPLGEWLDRRRDLYLTTHNIHKRLTSMPRSKSNPPSLQASGRRHTPQTVRPLGSANYLSIYHDFDNSIRTNNNILNSRFTRSIPLWMVTATSFTAHTVNFSK